MKEGLEHRFGNGGVVAAGVNGIDAVQDCPGFKADTGVRRFLDEALSI